MIGDIPEMPWKFGYDELIPYRDRTISFEPLHINIGVKNQLANILGLHWFASETGLFGQDSLPIPVQVEALTEFPIDCEEREKHPETWNLSKINPGYKVQPDFMQIALVSPCGVRLPPLVRILTRRIKDDDFTKPEVGIELVNCFLEFAYSLYGECFIPPESPIIDTKVMDLVAFAHYLTEAYKENSEAAERIIFAFGEKTLRVIGALHGAGAALPSGAWLQDRNTISFGQPEPGGKQWPYNTLFRALSYPTLSAPFSTDLFGIMHNFAYGDLPWLSTQTERESESRSSMAAQRINLDEWAASNFWFQFMLRGFDGCHSEMRLQENIFPVVDEWLECQPKGSPIRPHYKLARANTPNGVIIKDARLQALYEDQYSRGMMFRRDW